MALLKLSFILKSKRVPILKVPFLKNDSACSDFRYL
nr:MAG TPA: hypothetical protein [Caudoviricetes sp.]